MRKYPNPKFVPGQTVSIWDGNSPIVSTVTKIVWVPDCKKWKYFISGIDWSFEEHELDEFYRDQNGICSIYEP